MNQNESPIERFAALVRQELGADEVRIVEGEGDGAGTFGSATTLSVALGNDRQVLVAFFTAPPNLESLRERLELLVASFGQTVGAEAPWNRAAPVAVLHDELEALARRAGAADAVVIDARSPIVWGATEDELALRPSYEPDVIPLPERVPSSAPPTPPGDGADVLTLTLPAGPHRAPGDDALAYRAISAVRALPEVGTLHRGGHLRHSVREADFGFVARSFASIYVLIVVFDSVYDEVGAERAIVHALPAIERLVTALPPIDPTPVTGRMAIRRPRRR